MAVVMGATMTDAAMATAPAGAGKAVGAKTTASGDNDNSTLRIIPETAGPGCYCCAGTHESHHCPNPTVSTAHLSLAIPGVAHSSAMSEKIRHSIGHTFLLRGTTGGPAPARRVLG